jgi:acyl carrier protein
MKEEVKEEIKSLMGIIFEIDPETITDDASPDNIENWDSLRHMNLIVAIEEEFNIQFTDEEILELLNFELITEVVNEKLN